MTNTFKKISALFSAPLFLVLAVSAAFLPFLNLRVLRMAGDEKVYVSQAIEMARDGRWFIQTLSGQSDYYKGPLHYLFVRVGMLLFGDSLFAATYMNYLFALIGGLAVFYFARKRWSEESAMLYGVATALNVGVVSHAYASQMEVQLCGIYALALAALGWSVDTKKGHYLRDLPFWICAGIAGWSKSPVHSALIGTSGILFWLLTGTLVERLKSVKAWLSVFTGIFICIAGYLPVVIFDYDNFVGYFLGRENVEKPNNGRHVDYVVRSLPHFMFPWTVAGLVGIFASFKLLKSKSQDAFMAKLAWAMALPTIVFFCAFPYKGQNYNLPTISALILFGWAAFSGRAPIWSHRIAGGAGVLATGLLAFLLSHFFSGEQGRPEWWGLGWIVASFVFLIAFAAIFLKARSERALTLGATLLFAGFATAITPVGTRELRDIQSFIKEHPQLTYHYSNLERTIWSEWGLMQLALGRTMNEIHSSSQLRDALQPGHAVLISGDEAMNLFQKTADDEGIQFKDFNATTWKRWMTKGKNAKGEVLWKVAWNERDLRVLERDFYIIWKE